MTKLLRLCFYSSLAISFGGMTVQATPLLTFTPDPADGQVSGAAGSTVGWGFTITNTSATDYVLISNTDFCPEGALDQINGCPAPGHPNYGTYTDSLSLNGSYNTLNPLQTETLSASGLGSFVINPALTPGIYTGALVIYYDVLDGTSFDQLFSEHVTAAASIDVVPSDATPEPGTIVLLLPALGMVGYKLRGKILPARG